jgi:hypothetical protein
MPNFKRKLIKCLLEKKKSKLIKLGQKKNFKKYYSKSKISTTKWTKVKKEKESWLKVLKTIKPLF